VVGRNNWLFYGSDKGGRTGAVLSSLIASCKRLRVEPFAYLRDLLMRVSTHPTTASMNCFPTGGLLGRVESQALTKKRKELLELVSGGRLKAGICIRRTRTEQPLELDTLAEPGSGIEWANPRAPMGEATETLPPMIRTPAWYSLVMRLRLYKYDH
jgi:hypothetical protein